MQTGRGTASRLEYLVRDTALVVRRVLRMPLFAVVTVATLAVGLGMFAVVYTVVELTPLNEDSAKERTMEAHETGVALLLVTHKERAELYKEQFASKGLTVSIEPAEGG